LKENNVFIQYIEENLKYTRKQIYGNHIKYFLDEKIFCIIYTGNEKHLILKANGKFNHELRKEFPNTVLPSYAINGYHWNMIFTNRDLPDNIIFKLIDTSYNEVIGNMTKRQKGLYQYIINSINLKK